MSRSLASVIVPIVLVGTVSAFDIPASDSGTRIPQLVEDLGNGDFATRQAAERQLDAVGEPALAPLRPACRSANPEVARRAQTLVARIERRIENERTLAPTLVELNVEKGSVSDLLADLSKQSDYTLTLDASPEGDDRSKLVTVKSGKVPFWAAVLQICDAADLQISSVSGYISPGSRMLPTARPRPQQLPTIGGRTSRRSRSAADFASSPSIVLEPRGKEPKRPNAVFGAVLIEAFPAPLAACTPDSEAALLQVWPEPKLNWQEVKGLSIDLARNEAGRLLSQTTPDLPTPPGAVEHLNGVVVIQQANGGVILMNEAGATKPVALHTLTPRQTLVRLKPGTTPSDLLKELKGSVYGTVRSKPEPLVRLKKLKLGEQAEGSHSAGVDMKATLTRGDNDSWQVLIELVYDQAAVLPSDLGADTGRGPVRVTGGGVMGIRVVDADGEPFELSITGSRATIRGARLGNRNQVIRLFTFSVIPREGAVPEEVSFWGTYPKGVEVPFDLAAVPTVRGR